MTKDEALKVALEALEHEANIGNDDAYKLERDVIKEALAQPEQKSVAMADYMALTEKYVALKAAQPEQEPVAWRYRWSVEGGNWVWNYATYIERQKDDRCEPLYTTPPQRTWVGLTEKDICEATVKSQEGISPHDDTLRFAIAIEAKLKEKNT